MPFYEYQCDACGAHHEAMQKMSEAPLKKCPQCGKSKLRRLISAPVFRLKGGGWYETDFKSEKEAKRNLHGEESKESKESKDSGEAKGGDAKSDAAAKPDAKPAETAATGAKDATADAKSTAKPKPPARARRSSRRAPRRR